MIALLQRVNQAKVEVDGETIAQIEQGLLVFLGFEREDAVSKHQRMLDRILGYRVFEDQSNRMNQSLSDIEGGLLIVSQFTLAADTKKGMRPSFSTAAAPALAQVLYDDFLALAKAQYSKLQCGRFGADMQISLQNDGPVTFYLTL